MKKAQITLAALALSASLLGGCSGKTDTSASGTAATPEVNAKADTTGGKMSGTGTTGGAMSDGSTGAGTGNTSNSMSSGAGGPGNPGGNAGSGTTKP